MEEFCFGDWESNLFGQASVKGRGEFEDEKSMLVAAWCELGTLSRRWGSVLVQGSCLGRLCVGSSLPVAVLVPLLVLRASLEVFVVVVRSVLGRTLRIRRTGSNW